MAAGASGIQRSLDLDSRDLVPLIDSRVSRKGNSPFPQLFFQLKRSNIEKIHLPIALYLVSENSFLYHSTTYHSLKTISLTHLIAIQYISQASDIGNCIRKIAGRGSIDMLIIGAHGTPDTIKLPTRDNTRADELKTEDFALLSPSARIFLFSCSVGATVGGFAQRVAIISRHLVFAPKNLMYFDKTCFVPCKKHRVLEMRSYDLHSEEQIITAFLPRPGQRSIDYCATVPGNDREWFTESSYCFINYFRRFILKPSFDVTIGEMVLANESLKAVRTNDFHVFEYIMDFAENFFFPSNFNNFINRILKIVDRNSFQRFKKYINKLPIEQSAMLVNKMARATLSPRQTNLLMFSIMRNMIKRIGFLDYISTFSDKCLDIFAYIITHEMTDISSEILDNFIESSIVQDRSDILKTIMRHRIADISSSMLRMIRDFGGIPDDETERRDIDDEIERRDIDDEIERRDIDDETDEIDYRIDETDETDYRRDDGTGADDDPFVIMMDNYLKVHVVKLKSELTRSYTHRE